MKNIRLDHNRKFYLFAFYENAHEEDNMFAIIDFENTFTEYEKGFIDLQYLEYAGLIKRSEDDEGEGHCLTFKGFKYVDNELLEEYYNWVDENKKTDKWFKEEYKFMYDDMK